MRFLLVRACLALAGCRAEPRKHDLSNFDPGVGAEFRAYARDFLSKLNPTCELTTHRKSLAKLELLEKGWSDLRSKFRNKPLAADIAISEADHAFEVANRPIAECADPDVDGTNPDLQARLGVLTNLLAELQRTADGLPKKIEIGQ